MATPGNMPQMAPEDGEEAEDFDAEQGERENVRGGGEPRGEHRGGHERRIRREGGWESAGKLGAIFARRTEDLFGTEIVGEKNRKSTSRQHLHHNRRRRC